MRFRLSTRTLIFGSADFWKPGAVKARLHEARKFHLEAVIEAESEVLDELRAHVFPLYLKWNGKSAISRIRVLEPDRLKRNRRIFLGVSVRRVRR